VRANIAIYSNSERRYCIVTLKWIILLRCKHARAVTLHALSSTVFAVSRQRMFDDNSCGHISRRGRWECVSQLVAPTGQVIAQAFSIHSDRSFPAESHRVRRCYRSLRRFRSCLCTVCVVFVAVSGAFGEVSFSTGGECLIFFENINFYIMCNVEICSLRRMTLQSHHWFIGIWQPKAGLPSGLGWISLW